jgi:integrase
VQPTGVRSWILRHGRTGRTTIGRVGVMPADEARAKALRIAANVREGLPPWTGIREDGTTVGDFIDGDWAKWAKVNRKAASVAKEVYRLRSAFKKWWTLPLRQLTPQMIENFKNDRIGAGRTANTVARDISALSGVCQRAKVTFKLISHNPCRDVEKPKLDRRPKVRFLSPAEEKRLRKALAERDRRAIEARRSANDWRQARGRDPLPDLLHFADHLPVAVLLSLNTGLRFGELAALRWVDVDFKHRMVTVRADDAKTGQSRHIPANDEAHDVLKRWHEQNPHTERVIGIDTSCKTAWWALLKEAGIENFRWHDMRHHFASRLVQGGTDLNTVRDLGGWQDYKMVLRYAHLAPDQGRAAVAKLDVVRDETG